MSTPVLCFAQNFPTNALISLTNSASGKVYKNAILDYPSDTGIVFHARNGAVGFIKYTDLSPTTLKNLGLHNVLDEAKKNEESYKFYTDFREAKDRYETVQQSQANATRQEDAVQQAQIAVQKTHATAQRAAQQAEIAVQAVAQQSQVAIQHAQAEASYNPTDPYRKINGQINYAKGSNWIKFAGTVLEVLPAGIIVEGRYELPGQENDERIFFVKRFPYKYGETETLPKNLTAQEASLYTYQPVAAAAMTVSKGTHAIRQLDYGIPCDPTEDLINQVKETNKHAVEAVKAAEAQKIENAKAIKALKVEAAEAAETKATAWLKQKIQDAKVAEAQRTKAAKAVETADAALQEQQQQEAYERAFKSDERVFKWLLTQVTNGGASTQCSLGKHYLTGQGCQQDREQAVYWLTQAANQGDTEASNALQNLNQKNIEQAVYRLTQAANQGNIEASNALQNLNQKTTEAASPFDN